MIEMANNGAKVLHNKCVKMAKKYNIPIIVKSSFLENEGTVVK
jgi:aspartate kinase